MKKLFNALKCILCMLKNWRLDFSSIEKCISFSKTRNSTNLFTYYALLCYYVILWKLCFHEHFFVFRPAVVVALSFISISVKFIYARREFYGNFYHTYISVVIWFSTGTLGTFAILAYVFTMRVVIYDILSIAIIPTQSTSL